MKKKVLNDHLPFLSTIVDYYCLWQHIESWLSSAQDHERERAVCTTAQILDFYLKRLTVKVSTHTHKHALNLRYRCSKIHILLHLAFI